jgi:hypothetical protein
MYLLLATALVVPPAFAQNKAGLTKSVAEFHVLSQGLAASLADLSKRTATASPNDKDMLKLATHQLGLVDATADGVLALGTVAAEVRDAGDLAIAKKHLASRCNALKSLAEASAKYVSSVASNMAAVATVAEATKASDLVAQLGRSTLCNPGGKG